MSDHMVMMVDVQHRLDPPEGVITEDDLAYAIEQGLSILKEARAARGKKDNSEFFISSRIPIRKDPDKMGYIVVGDSKTLNAIAYTISEVDTMQQIASLGQNVSKVLQMLEEKGEIDIRYQGGAQATDQDVLDKFRNMLNTNAEDGDSADSDL